ncbi:MAG: hypothetical protein WD749_02880 [Phycisphaerales bacterium]
MPHDPLTQTETATLVRLSDQLTTALRAVIDSSPLAGLGPIEAARTLGIDKTLASRLMTALRAPDPLVALSSLPGVSPLRQFVRAARLHGADPRTVKAAEAELSAFNAELQRTYGTRTGLDAILADALPDTRRRQQEGARQLVHRGMALLKGISIDLASVTWIVHPSRARPDRVDILVLAAFVGVRRLRPTARVRFAASHSRTRPEEHARLVTPFCRPADLAISTTREGALTVYEIATGPIRRDASSDVFLSETLPAATPLASPAEGPDTFCLGDCIAHPYRRLALRMIIHESAWPGCDFALAAYDTSVRGAPVRLPDPARDADVLPLDAPILRSRLTPDTLRSFPVPNYHAALEHLTAPLGWDLTGARMFTGEMAYPLYGSEVLFIHQR